MPQDPRLTTLGVTASVVTRTQPPAFVAIQSAQPPTQIAAPQAVPPATQSLSADVALLTPRIQDLKAIDPAVSSRISLIPWGGAQGVERSQLTVPLATTEQVTDTTIFEDPQDPSQKVLRHQVRGRRGGDHTRQTGGRPDVDDAGRLGAHRHDSKGSAHRDSCHPPIGAARAGAESGTAVAIQAAGKWAACRLRGGDVHRNGLRRRGRAREVGPFEYCQAERAVRGAHRPRAGLHALSSMPADQCRRSGAVGTDRPSRFLRARASWLPRPRTPSFGIIGSSG